jgi:isopenicillin-N N-acyltransferase-like protein
MRILEFSGTHGQVGRQHGEALREELGVSIQKRLARCAHASAEAGRELTVEQVRGLCRRSLPHLRAFSPGLAEEIEGIAAAAGQCVEDVFLAAGYTDLIDAVTRAGGGELDMGCTAFWAGPAATTDGSAFLGQTWDMFADALDDVLAVRIRVTGEPELIALSYAGCVGMMGANAEGVGVMGNNLTPNDARPGVPWVFQCREILRHRTTEAAVAAMRRAYLCSGHNFLIADAKTGVSIETTGTQYLRIDPPGPVFAHTNHYLTEAGKRVALPNDPLSSTRHRNTRMGHLLDTAVGRIDGAYLERCLADQDGAPYCISSGGYDLVRDGRVATCAAILANLTARQVALIHGPPAPGRFQTIQL